MSVDNPTTDLELIQQWSSNIQRGDAFRRRIYSDTKMRRFEGYFRNKYPGINDNEYELNVGRRLKVQTDSIIAREARKMTPKIVFDVPYISIKPLAGRTVTHAKVLERVINGILATIRLDRELKKAVLSATQLGTSFLKPGFDSLYVPSYKEVLSMGFSNGAYDKKGRRREFKDTVFPGMPWVGWQHPRNVTYPEMTEDFNDSRWVSFRYFRNLNDCKRDKRLTNTSKLQPVNYRYAEIDPAFITDLPVYPTVADKVLLTEVRDKEKGMMYIFAEDHNKILYKEEDALMRTLGGKLPCYPLVFNYNTDYAYGTSDIEGVEEDLRQLIDLRTQHVKNTRLRVLKFAYTASAISGPDLHNLVSGKVGAGIKIKGNLDNSFKPLDMPHQYDFVAEERDIERRIKQQFGANAFETYPSSRRGTGEVQGAQEDATISINERQAIVRALVVEIAKDIANMIFRFWTEETVVDVLAPVTSSQTNPETGQMEEVDITRQVWVSFTGRELMGDFDYYITPTSGRYQDATAGKREALELIAFFSKIPGINMQELVKQLGDKFEGIDVDKLFMPMNTPNTPMMMNQMQKMEAMKQGQGLTHQTPNL